MPVIHNVTCGECGCDLTIEKCELDSDNDLFITVSQCETCVDEAKSEGDDNGYSRGYDDGVDEGRAQAEQESAE